ncbi:MAG: DNA polymerase III subunit delta [Acidimicrobiia bacterium]
MGVHLLTGDDESLLSGAASELVHRLVGDGDRSLMVDDFDGEEYEINQVVDAAQTPPFLTDQRVVIGRGIGRFKTDEVAPLVAYLTDPLPSTELVLIGGGGRMPKVLVDAVKQAGGHVVATGAPTGKKDRSLWIEEQLAAVGLALDSGAMVLVGNWMGEDAGRLRAVLDTLVSTYGTERKLSAADVAPFLGEGGGIPPWDLTDAIDRGDVPGALALLTRMVRAGDRHPLQVMAILHGHYTRLMKLDGAEARSESEAAEILNVKSGFQARKVLDQYRKLGGTNVVQAVHLLAQADLDLRGVRDLPDEAVMEILVARLCRLSPRTTPRR